MESQRTITLSFKRLVHECCINNTYSDITNQILYCAAQSAEFIDLV